MADPPHTDPADQDPRERGLQERSGGPSISPGLVIVLVLMLGAVAYVVSAMIAR